MKKHLITAGKAIAFFTLWGASLAVMVIPALDKPAFLNNNAAFLRLWWELVPLLSVLIITGIFVWVIEKSKITVLILKRPLKNIIFGMLLGCVWLGATILFLCIIGVLRFVDKNRVSYLVIWFIAALLNVIMQEYLVRGYLFSLFKKNYNTVVAVIVTTILFTAMHAGAFEAGAVAVFNVATMSIFVSLLLIYTESLLAPIMVHFIWNSAGHLIFGVISLADDYPKLWNGRLSGNNLLSGGVAQIEGSIVVLAMNLFLISFMAYLLKRRAK